MKKKMFLILTLVMISIIVTPLVVSANGEVEEHVPKLKEIFNIGDEYEEMDIFQNTYRGDDIYDISWMSDNDHISVEIHIDGSIIRYSKYNMAYGEEHSRFPKVGKEEALKKADEILLKIDPSLLDKFKYDDRDIHGDLNSYYFMYTRNENGIPFHGDNISVVVDKYTGEVTSVNIDWDKNMELPSKDNIISEEEAYEFYQKDQDVELVYRLSMKDKDLEGNYLYSIIDRNRAINAKNGENVENLNTGIDYIYYGILFEAREKVSIEEQNKLANSKEIISKDEAAKKLKEFADLDESYRVEATTLMKNESIESYIWKVEIHKQEANHGYSTSVSVDAKTNDVLNFHKFSMEEFGIEEGTEEKYTEEEALEKAKEFLQEKMPEKYKEVEYGGSMFYEYQENVEEYSFTFKRLIDGVKVPQNGFSLSVNSATGEIVSYNYVWNNIKLPSKEELIEKDRAKETLLKDQKLELNYIIDKNSIKNKEKEVKLVYSLSSEENVFLDPKTGEELSLEDLYDIESENGREKEYLDIDESYAKEEIKKLKENGIYLEGENFYPKKDIIQKDFLYLLSNTKGYIAPYDEEYIYDMATRQGVVKSEEKNPEATITRGEAIKYLVRSFDYEKAASLKGVYKSNYKDMDEIPEELKGYVAVAEGLGLISGKGNFNANDNLTRQDAALIIYNILSRD